MQVKWAAIKSWTPSRHSPPAVEPLPSPLLANTIMVNRLTEGGVCLAVHKSTSIALCNSDFCTSAVLCIPKALNSRTVKPLVTMKALLLSALLACTLAAPQSAPPTKRAVEYPEHAEIQVVSNRGPGCPIQSTDRRVSVVDYMWGTLSENEAKTDSIWRRALNLPFTMTPSAWYEGYGDNDRWCEHTWKVHPIPGGRDLRLRLIVYELLWLPLDGEQERHRDHCAVPHG